MKNLRSINETYLFKIYNKTLDLNGTIMKIMTDPNTKVLGNEELSEYTRVFDIRYNFPMKSTVMQYYNQGIIKLVYNPKNFRLPNTIPCFLVNRGSRIDCIVNISNFMTVNKNGNYNIEPKTLYSLMNAGTALATCYQKFQMMKNKTSILKVGSEIYSTLFTKVINKSFSLSVTPAKCDVITCLSSLFFLINLMGRDEEALYDINVRYAMDNCRRSSDLVVNDVLDQFEINDFKDLDAFITAIGEKVPGLESINTRSFTEQYVSSFGPNMLMALEYLPTFVGNLCYIMIGSYLNNQHALDNLIGHNITKFITEFTTL